MSATSTFPGGKTEDHLTRAWQQPPGFVGWLSAVNHKTIGMRFIVTGFIFFLVGGLMALLMRAQLAVPENTFLGAELYNQLFTMHGTTMMFLFAIPMLEGLALYLLPLMLGTRDVPFPRLNSFGYWLYLFGGLFVFSSFLTGQVPDAGWFAYVPLSAGLFSPDLGMDFWLLGVTMVEISGILGALELVLAFLRRRAPGMTLNRIPLFAWSVFVMAAMMVVAFPVLVAASTMLEFERATPLVFFDAALGGDPLLWQHLFWFFGHPEVYIMLLPAAGMASMIVSTFSRRVMAGYGWVIGAFVAIGIASFGLWVHHMFAVGLPSVALVFFTAASVLIAIPSGVLVFAWLATLWGGRPVFKPPLLFVIGFLIVFVIGGITGVMVASVPFDLQAHDSFFIVAHLHYVLLGGVVFPTFAALYYWFPKFTGRMTGERRGVVAFWTMFVGVNLAFFPQHFLGLQGMPRRVFTYEVGLGWELGNVLSTIGAFVFAIGVALVIIDFLRAKRSGPDAGPDPWGANSLEWSASSPPPVYNFRLLPVVSSAYPLWEDEPSNEPRPDWIEKLGNPASPVREVVETSPVEAVAEEVVALPGPSLWPLWAALALVVTLLGVLISQPTLALIGAAALILTLIAWAGADGSETPETKITGGVGRAPMGIWGLWVGLLILAVLFGTLVVSHFYLMVVAPAPRSVATIELMYPLVAVALAVVAAATIAGARRWAADQTPTAVFGLLGLGLVLALALGAVGILVMASQSGVVAVSAQASSVMVVVGFGALAAFFLAGGLIAAAMQMARRSSLAASALHGAQIFAGFVAVTWIVIGAVLLSLPGAW